MPLWAFMAGYMVNFTFSLYDELPGVNSNIRIQHGCHGYWMRLTKGNAYYGTPSYAGRMECEL
jgi:hypothetical protein